MDKERHLNVTYSLSRREYLVLVKNDTGLGANHTAPCFRPSAEVDSGSATKGPPKIVFGTAPGERGAPERVSDDAIEAAESGRVGSSPGSVKR